MSTVNNPAAAPTNSADRVATVRLVAAVVITAVVVVFAALNSQTVRVHWIVTTTNAALILVIAISAVLGLIVGLILGRRMVRAKSSLD